MAKQFYFYFGSGIPATYTGLSPTFIIFNSAGMTLPPPGVTEFVSSGATGIYGFQYGSTISAAFVIDGGATLTSSSVRYIVGSIDPVMSVDQNFSAIQSAIGSTSDSFGSTSMDPVSLFGFAKRQQEFNEGNKVFTKATGLWDIYSRGSSILLREKGLANTTTSATST